MAASHLGKEGEERVAKYLKSLGYIIVKRNWRDRYGEIDIIAENDEYIVFVEVKTRTENALVSGLEAITASKKRKIINTSQMFLNRMNTELKARIDVAEVTVHKNQDGSYHWKLNYIKFAF